MLDFAVMALGPLKMMVIFFNVIIDSVVGYIRNWACLTWTQRHLLPSNRWWQRRSWTCCGRSPRALCRAGAEPLSSRTTWKCWFWPPQGKVCTWDWSHCGVAMLHCGAGVHVQMPVWLWVSMCVCVCVYMHVCGGRMVLVGCVWVDFIVVILSSF